MSKSLRIILIILIFNDVCFLQVSLVLYILNFVIIIVVGILTFRYMWFYEISFVQCKLKFRSIQVYQKDISSQ